MGKKLIKFLFNFSLDKLCLAWYNGNNARMDHGRAVETFIIPHSSGFVNRKNKDFDFIIKRFKTCDSDPQTLIDKELFFNPPFSNFLNIFRILRVGIYLLQ